MPRWLAILVLTLGPVYARATTVTLYPTSHAAVDNTGWSVNTANAYSGTDSNAVAQTASIGSKNTQYSGNFSGFDFSSIPAGNQINSVTIEVRWRHTANSTGSTLTAQLRSDGTLIGTQLSRALVTSLTADTLTVSGVVTRADLDAGFAVFVVARRGTSNTATAGELEYVRIVVDHQQAQAQLVGSAAGEATATAALTTSGAATTPTNLLLYSEEFQRSAPWYLENATISADATTAPDSTTTADKLVNNTTNSAHRVIQFLDTEAGKNYVFSVYAKAGERKYLRIFNDGNGFSGYSAMLVDLSTGTAAAHSATATYYGVIDAGNGWYRCYVGTPAASSVASMNWYVEVDDDTGTDSYAGNGTGIYIWGAQLSPKSEIEDYVKTTDTQVIGGTVTSAALDGSGAGALAADGALTGYPQMSGAAAGALVVNAAPLAGHPQIVGNAANGSATGSASLTGKPRLVGTSEGALSIANSALTTAIRVIGTAAGQATTTAALAAYPRLVGSAAGGLAATGAFADTRILANAAAGALTATGALTGYPRLVGAAAGAGTGSAALTARSQFVGSAAASATATAGLTTIIRAVGSAAGSLTASGPLAAYPRLVGAAAAGSSTATAALTTVIRAVGSAAGELAASGDLTTGAKTTIDLVGVADALSTASATLTKYVNFVGSTLGAATATAGLTDYPRFVGSASGALTATASLAARTKFVGAAATALTASGAVTTSILMGGVADALSAASATLTKYVNFVGAADLISDTLGMLTAHPTFIGGAAGELAATAALLAGSTEDMLRAQIEDLQRQIDALKEAKSGTLRHGGTLRGGGTEQ